MLDQRLARAIQGVLSNNEPVCTLNATLKRLIDDYAIGTIRGKSVYFSDKDRDEMRSLLIAKGYSVEKSDLSGMSRHQRLSVTPNEKAGGETVKKNRISIKSLSGQVLLLGDEKIRHPDRGHLDVEWTEIADQIRHTCIMVVENYENFNLIHKIGFDLPEQFKSPLVVYRGDANESRLDNVLAFLRHMNLPVLAFIDADLAGIFIASQLPGLAGLVTPSIIELEGQLMDGSARQDLFYNQYPVYGSALEKMDSTNCCYFLWNLISKHKACVVQERWIESGSVCSILTINRAKQGHHY